jgi:apolipoprotein N-acyltransferase
MQFINDWNPITYLIEAIRTLMTTGFEWGPIGAALMAIVLMGIVLQAATMWAFSRLTH